MMTPRWNALNSAGVTAEPLACTSPVRDRRQDLRGGLERHELDIEPLLAEVALLVSDEEPGIRQRADGADLDRHARIERHIRLRPGGRREQEACRKHESGKRPN
jgi:hypothetical protein